MREEPEREPSLSRLENEVRRFREHQDQLLDGLAQQMTQLQSLVEEVRGIVTSTEQAREATGTRPRSTGQRIVMSWLWIAYAIIVTLALAVVITSLFVR